jgi:hypothetical protein
MENTKGIIEEYMAPVCHVMEMLPEGVLCSSIEDPNETLFPW